MNNDFVLVDPKAWEYDLHSVYSAYVGYFQVYNIPWYDRSWGHFFESFDEFLGFNWPVITVTDVHTGRPHIVTRLTAINSFIKMVKTRFGETLPQPPNILQIRPFESSQRRQRYVSDYVTYSRLHATLPAAYIAAVKARVRSGEPKVIRELWGKRDKTFLAIDFEWNERNEHTVLEWGYAALRCGHLDALGHWPPNPDTNYRKGHYIVSEYVDKIVNKHTPTYPWQFAFGESQVVSKAQLPQIIQTIISSLASPDSETAVNTLVLVAHGMQGILSRLDEMKIKLPSNMVALDTAILERALYSSGLRPAMMDPKTEKPRADGTALSLDHLLISFTLPPLSLPNDKSSRSSGSSGTHTPAPVVLPQCTLHNAGNDAFMTLFAFQKLMEPHSSHAPTVSHKHTPNQAQMGSPYMNPGLGGMPRQRVLSHTGSVGWPMVPSPMPLTPPMGMNGYGFPAYGMPVNGHLGVPSGGGGLSPNMTMTMPHGRSGLGINGSLPRPRSAAYDLAGEFGNMQVSSGSGSSGAENEQARGRAPMPRNHSSPGTLGRNGK